MNRFRKKNKDKIKEINKVGLGINQINLQKLWKSSQSKCKFIILVLKHNKICPNKLK